MHLMIHFTWAEIHIVSFYHSLKLNPFVNIEGLVSLTSTSKLYLAIHEFIYCS